MASVAYDKAAHAAAEMEGRHLTFWVSDQLFALPIESVVQIVQMQEIVRIPDYPHYAKGIIHLRGSIIPVMDLRLRLGQPEIPYTERTCILVCSIRGRAVGLIVDAVEEVMDVDAADIAPPPDIDALTNEYLQGIVKTKTGMILILSGVSILGDEL